MGHRLGELVGLFLKLGTISFGGPAAHLALMEQEVVERRGWLARGHFLDLLSATYLIPGPNALEMAAHVGYVRAGVPGCLTAATAFTLPAALLSALLAWAYSRYGALPYVEPFLWGIKPAILAIMLASLARLAQGAVKNWQTGLVGLAVAGAVAAGVQEVGALVAGGVAGAVLLGLTQPPSLPPTDPIRSPPVSSPPLPSDFSAHSPPSPHTKYPAVVPPWLPAGFVATAAKVSGAAGPVCLASLTFVFLKIGAVLYGSGYVLVAYLRGEMVLQRGWLSEQQLLDAVAAGQITPGPLLSTATFVGYLLAGPAGAALGTVAIILPGLLLVLLTNRWIGRLRSWSWSARFFDAVNAASIGLTTVVGLFLIRTTLVDWRSGLIALLAAAAVLRCKAPLALVVLGAGLAGWLLSGFG